MELSGWDVLSKSTKLESVNSGVVEVMVAADADGTASKLPNVICHTSLKRCGPSVAWNFFR
jgi:hypothetical protein